MTEPPKCGRLQTDSHGQSQKSSQSQKCKFDKTLTKIDRSMEIFANHLFLIMENYLVKSFFIILLKRFG